MKITRPPQPPPPLAAKAAIGGESRSRQRKPQSAAKAAETAEVTTSRIRQQPKAAMVAATKAATAVATATARRPMFLKLAAPGSSIMSQQRLADAKQAAMMATATGVAIGHNMIHTAMNEAARSSPHSHSLVHRHKLTSTYMLLHWRKKLEQSWLRLRSPS